MRLAKIITDEEYRSACAEIERLMVAQPLVGTEEGDRLDVLSLLVAEYEGKTFPIDLPSPIDALKFRMEQLGLSPRNLIPFIGSRSRVSEVLSGKRPLTLTMLRALHSGLGIPAAVLLKEQEQEVVSHEPASASKYPLREMASIGWIDAPKRITGTAAEELMKEFASPLGGFEPATARLRRTRTMRSARTMDSHALDAWCMRVRIRCLDHPIDTKFDRSQLTDAVFREIAQLSSRPDGPVAVESVLRSLGIFFVVERHLKKTHLDGAALWADKTHPIVALTVRHDRLDTFWFCLLHELDHIARHLGESQACIDDLDSPGTDSKIEREADSRASEALVPSDRFRSSRAYLHKTAAAAIELANELRVHPAVVAGRVRFESKNYRILSSLVPSGEVRRHFPEVFEGVPK